MIDESKIQVVPMGATGVKHPNDWFRISMKGNAISREHQKKIEKHLPTKRR